jgi:hypothetical protein
LRRTSRCGHFARFSFGISLASRDCGGSRHSRFAGFTLRTLRFRVSPGSDSAFVRPDQLVRIGIPLSFGPALRVFAHRSPRELHPFTMALLRFFVSTARGIRPILAWPCGQPRSVSRVRPV